ncbi:hypothetical protein LTR36_001512 [Oleoguttula mirabilis]|uniref:Heterokaryon incompatibility domain-containing protein n=1 Tax=Oleoguttula mirabilis TaxID=1507867 RepID=A0AAV9JMJ5_9PEZI|nr:hypothetical protein LTR36_001512 [Oleoguttula mirabilis]
MNYVILSHRWGDEEVSYEDFILAQQVDEYPEWWPPSVHGRRVRQKAGYDKITTFCLVAKRLDFMWCWVDTCCIDKRSSAELSEAINSMWKWYKDSAVCLVYMSDVTFEPDPRALGIIGKIKHSFITDVDELEDDASEDDDSVDDEVENEGIGEQQTNTVRSPVDLDIGDDDIEVDATENHDNADDFIGSDNVEDDNNEDVELEDDEDAWGTFRKSAWFTRCWTMQELLAPKVLDFYTSAWINFGRIAKWPYHKACSLPERLGSELAQATGIPQKVLLGTNSVYYTSIAQRMSWAAGRQATRVEDVAYSLLGLFGINMPLLYGEGPKAFIRLQHEILRQSSDLSIFAWKWRHDYVCCRGCYAHKLLAESPEPFAESGDVRASMATTLPPNISSLGLDITVDGQPVVSPGTVRKSIILVTVGHIATAHGNPLQRTIALLLSRPPEVRHEAMQGPSAIDGRSLSCKFGHEMGAEYPPDACTWGQVKPYRLFLPIR